MPSKTTPKLERTDIPNVYKRGDRYVATYTDLNRRRRKVFARTKKEAIAKRAEMMADVNRGEWHAPAKVTFTDYAGEWIGGYQGRTSKGVRDATRNDYRRRLGLDADGLPRRDKLGRCTGDGAVGFFGHRRLAEITPRDVKAYATQLAASGLAPNTVRLVLAPVKCLFASAVEDGLIRTNPTLGVRIVTPTATSADDEPKAKALTEDELRAFLGEIRCGGCNALDEAKEGCAECAGWQFWFTFLAATGLRIGEMLALAWEHVDLGRRRLLVRRRWYQGSFAPPKSKYGRREIPLSTDMCRRLWDLRQTAGDGDLVFPSKVGTALNASNVAQRVLKPAAARAGVPWMSFHTLRHTFGSILFRRGLNAKQVQVLLGHHSPAFTLAVYVHLMEDDLPDADGLELGFGMGDGRALEPAATGRDVVSGELPKVAQRSDVAQPAEIAARSF
jgi:integrase